MQLADTGGLSWREPREERERGECTVTITGTGPTANPDGLATLVARQMEIDPAEAWPAIEGLAQGQPIVCQFNDPGKARLFAMVCRTKGAVCEVVE